MNLIKIFKEEFLLAVIMFAVFIFTLSRIDEPTKNNWITAVIYLIMIWAIYYFTFVMQVRDFKLDEREILIFTKTGHLSSFVFLSILLILFYLQNNPVPFIKANFKDLWGRFLLPIYVFVHAVTGLILSRKEES